MTIAYRYSRARGLAFACALLASASCSDKGTNSADDSTPSLPVDVQASPSKARGALATVNGVSITENDVLLKTQKGPKIEITPARSKAILETLIREELVRQAALDRGLDKDEAYVAERDLMRARVAQFERGKLGKLFFRSEVVGKAAASEALARQFFDRNKTMIETDLHVLQILSRSEDEISKSLAELASGATFEAVAGRRFKTLPKGRAPWDLGFLRWKQMPKAWRDQVYGLEAGASSQIIRGPKSRFWIVKVVAKRVDPRVTFEAVKPTILDELKGRAIAELRAQTIAELRSSAKIDYLAPATTP